MPQAGQLLKRQEASLAEDFQRWERHAGLVREPQSANQETKEVTVPLSMLSRMLTNGLIELTWTRAQHGS